MHSEATKLESSYHSQCCTISYTVAHISERSRETVLPREQKVQAEDATRRDPLTKAPLENVVVK